MGKNYSDWLGRSVQPEQPQAALTGAAYWKNWWHYHWKLVLAVAAAAALVAWVVLDMFGVGEAKPDYQIAYVGTSTLPEQTAQAITDAFASLGKDENGDGQVLVQLNQYVESDNENDPYSAQDSYIASVKFTADLTSGDSYFLLVEDPDAFQQEFAALAMPDGSCPAEDDESGMDKVYRWADCPALAAIDLGTYEQSVLGQLVTGQNSDLVENLYLGRRCFFDGSGTVKYADGCAQLWEALTAGAGQSGQ